MNILKRKNKKNKAADKLAKAGKKEGIINTSLSKKMEKIGRRKFEARRLLINY